MQYDQFLLIIHSEESIGLKKHLFLKAEIYVSCNTAGCFYRRRDLYPYLPGKQPSLQGIVDGYRCL